MDRRRFHFEMAFTMKLIILVVQCMVAIANTSPSDVCADAPECIELASILEPICWNLQASCIDNRCLCLKDGYNPCNCRPEVGDCRVKVADFSGSAATAYMGRRQIKTNSCVKEHQISQQQVHVISMHRGIEVGGNMEDTTVDVQPPTGNNPQNVVLVLASYKAVRWVINLPSYLNIHRLIIIESGLYNQPDAILNLNGSTISNREKLSTSVTGWGVGDDSDGFGNTPSLLKYLQDRFGEVTSFSGAIKANRWNISIGRLSDLPETSTLIREFPTTVSDIDSKRATTGESLDNSTINQSTTVETYSNDTDSDGGSSSNFCPVYICEKICLYGFDVDEYGCEICECNTSPDVICPDINCRIYCEYGYQRGSDGCERCICQPPPEVTCPDINCRIYCEYGYQRGSDGCERCICQPPPRNISLNDTNTDGGSFSNFCPVYMCNKTCEFGFDLDEYGCEICECNTSPEVTCPDINCRIHCEYGYQRGSDGCERCICQPPPCTNLDRCPIASCKTRFDEDDIGCPICACVPFPIENVSTSKNTVPVGDLDVTSPESSQMGTIETSLPSIITTVLESQIDIPSPSTSDSGLAGDSIRAPDNVEDQNPKYQSFVPDVPKNYTIPNP